MTSIHMATKEIEKKKRQELEEFIDANVSSMTIQELSKSTELTEAQVRYYCDKRGYIPKGLVRRSSKFTKEEIEANNEYIKKNYKTMTHQKMADKLGMTRKQVSNYCYANKLFKHKGELL